MLLNIAAEYLTIDLRLFHIPKGDSLIFAARQNILLHKEVKYATINVSYRKEDDYVAMVVTIITIIVAAISIGSIAWDIFMGIKRGAFNSALRFGFFLVSGIISYILALVLDNAISKTLISIVVPLIPEPYNGMTSAITMVEYIITGFLMPICFVLIYFVIDKLMLIPYKIVKSKLKNNEKLHNIKKDKLIGGIVGGVMGLIISLLCFMPLGGYSTYLDDTYATIKDTSLVEVIPDEIHDLVHKLKDSPILKINGKLTGGFFHTLTNKLDVATESASVLVHTYEAVLNTGGSSGSGGSGSNGTTPENKNDAIKNLQNSIKNLTHESAQLTADIIKDAVGTMIQDAHEDAPIEIVGNVLSDTILTLDKAKDNISEEEFHKEVETITHLIEVATTQENVDAAETVQTVLESKVISDAVSQNKEQIIEKYDNEFSNTSETTKTEIKNMIEDKKNSGEYEKYAGTIEIIEKVFGLK